MRRVRACKVSACPRSSMGVDTGALREVRDPPHLDRRQPAATSLEKGGLMRTLRLAAVTLGVLAIGVMIARAGPAARAAVTGPPTFGQPTISGIQGVGFEQDLRLDPTNANRAYTSVPGSLSSDT